MIKEIDTKRIEQAVAELCIQTNKILPTDLSNAISCAKCSECSDLGKDILEDLEKNIEAAKELDIPVCQDTGMAVVFLEIGQDVHLVGKPLKEAINCGVRKGYCEGLLRKSVVSDPLLRVNTDDNTPAIIHTEIVEGDKIKLTVAPKGFGSENMSRIYMLTPAADKQTIIDKVVETVKLAGGNPCPPMVIGVGIGGDFELSAYLSKKALCRPISVPNANPFYAELEEEILNAVNKTGVGPQGFGGSTTALSVAVEQYPTHIAGLPLAINIGCHVTRHKTIVIE
jgi:fumarate hydratase subunit alpha